MACASHLFPVERNEFSYSFPKKFLIVNLTVVNIINWICHIMQMFNVSVFTWNCIKRVLTLFYDVLIVILSFK